MNAFKDPRCDSTSRWATFAAYSLLFLPEINPALPDSLWFFPEFHGEKKKGKTIMWVMLLEVTCFMFSCMSCLSGYRSHNNALFLQRPEKIIVRPCSLTLSAELQLLSRSIFLSRKGKQTRGSFAWEEVPFDSLGLIKNPFNSCWCIVVILWYGAIKYILIAKGYIGISDVGELRFTAAGRRADARVQRQQWWGRDALWPRKANAYFIVPA